MLFHEYLAWVVYTVLFFLFFILLVARSRKHVILMLPFILFSFLSMVAHIVMLTRQYSHETSLLVVASRSPAVSYISMFSLLLYIGLAEYALIDIEQRVQQDQHQFKRKKPLVYWFVVGITCIYFSVTIALLALMVVLDDSKPSTRASEASLVTVLTILIFLFVRRRRLLLSLLFGLALTGISLETWLLRAMVEHPATADRNNTLTINTWLLMEALLVYLPIMMMLGLVSWKTGSLGSPEATQCALLGV